MGNDLYGKIHGTHAQTFDQFGILVEGVKLRTDGFKRLDGGGDTGFDKNNFVLKVRGNSAITKRVYNEVTAKFGYSDEVSNETYTGLSDADFEESPYRRYRATALDRIDWDHLQLGLVHKLEVGGQYSLVTQLYRHSFDRSWKKLNGFAVGTDLSAVLANPTGGNNAVLYSILTGESDSTSASEALILGTNGRMFVRREFRVSRPLGVAGWSLSTRSRLGCDFTTTRSIASTPKRPIS